MEVMHSGETLNSYIEKIASLVDVFCIKRFTGLQFNYDGTNLSYAIRMRIKDIGNTKSNTYYRTTSEFYKQTIF